MLPILAGLSEDEMRTLGLYTSSPRSPDETDRNFAEPVVIVGTPHLTGLDVAPSSEQTSHSVEALSAFRPTQVCVERMSGERIEMMLADPAGRGATFRRPELSSRRLASTIIPIGTKMQLRLGLPAGEARQQTNHLPADWDELDTPHRLQLIAFQLAGFEFHSAVLNWSYLRQGERSEAQSVLPPEAIEELNAALSSRSGGFLPRRHVGVPAGR